MKFLFVTVSIFIMNIADSYPLYSQERSCTVLRLEFTELLRSRNQIIREYPFTSSIIAGCSKEPEDSRAGCVITMCVLQALFVGQEQCITFASQLAAIEDRIKNIEPQMGQCQ